MSDKPEDDECYLCDNLAHAYYDCDGDPNTLPIPLCRYHLDKTRNEVLENSSDPMFNDSGNILH